MGNMYINGFLENNIDLDLALKIQLQNNHFPPVSLDFIPSCKKALDACLNDNSDKKIKMCNGITKSAWSIIEGLHLESFLDYFPNALDK